jgi:GNAT superfamily N-acetyltransferase
MPPDASIHGYTIQRPPALSDAHVHGLAQLLIDCVEGGASVSFMHPLPLAKAVDFWRGLAAAVAEGKRALLTAEDADGVVGTVQLILDQPENQPHRADLSKMLVHRRARRRGLGAALLLAAENLARDCGKSLLVLDTASGDAERLYARLGWQRCGVIPGYALWPQGGLCDTTYFYRTLPSVGASGGNAIANSSWMPISSIRNRIRSSP